MRLHFAGAVTAVALLFLVTPAPARAQAAEATVVCKDGTTSKGGRGACRGHGGVDKAASAKATGGAAATAGETKAKKAGSEAKGEARASGKADEQSAGTTVVCKDGSTSKGGRGACRGHGGVDRSATTRGAGATALPSPTAPTPPPAAAPTPPPAAAPTPPPAVAARAPASATAQAAAPPAAAARRAEKGGAEKGPPVARCKDGTMSYAQHHTGACSRHGGVAEWLDKTEKK